MAVFFDIGNTLASPALSPDHKKQHVVNGGKTYEKEFQRNATRAGPWGGDGF